MNDDEGRFIPPGSGRTAAFARQGGFAKSPLLSSGVGLLVVCAVFFVLKNHFFSELIESFRTGIENAAAKKISADAAGRESAAAFLHSIAPILLSLALGTGAVVIVLVSIFRRGKGSTATPLPKMPSARLAIGVIRIFAASVFLVSALLAVRRTTVDFANPTSWIVCIGSLFFRVSATLGGILVLAGCAEVLVLRHRIFRALFLNRQEAGREMRAETGNFKMLKKASGRFRRKAAL
jgi:flagellar biosynthesis protein FlhB